MCNEDKNIVLIGMPGSGKTTVGKILHKELGKRFIDMDLYIEEEYGKSITEIFEKGEEYFRELERKAVNKISCSKGIIISTGGGVIKNYSNINDLKKNGIVIFIDRPVENIAEDVTLANRPLLKDGVEKLYDILEERYKLYKDYCDFQVVNNGSIEDVVKEITRLIR